MVINRELECRKSSCINKSDAVSLILFYSDECTRRIIVAGIAAVDPIRGTIEATIA